MLKRFTAFLFILMIAGNVWAGVCGCLDDGSDQGFSCCKREAVGKDVFSAKPCCEKECAPAGITNLPRTQSESTINIPLPADTIAIATNFNFVLSAVLLRPAELAVPFVDKRLNLTRPPDLYLKHHSILI